MHRCAIRSLMRRIAVLRRVDRIPFLSLDPSRSHRFPETQGPKSSQKKKNQGGPKICPPSNTHKKVKIRRRESTNLRQTSYSRNSQTTRRFGIPIVDSHSFLATDNGLKIPARVARQKDRADIRALVCHCSLHSHSLAIRCSVSLVKRTR